MTNETQTANPTDNKPIPFGSRLKSARESLGFERKDVAAQLRLNEKIIIMMEKDRYPADLPVTFIRGYLRAYGKLLQIPEYEVKKAIEPIKPKPTIQSIPSSIMTPAPVTSGNYFMQFFTYLILFTLIGLVGMWWYSHSMGSSPLLSENAVQIAAPVETTALTTAPIAPVPPTAVAPLTPVTEATPPLAVTPPISGSANAPVQNQNNVDTSAKITNDTNTPTVAPAPKPAPIKKAVRAKRVVPVVEAEAQDLDSSQDGRRHTETQSD